MFRRFCRTDTFAYSPYDGAQCWPTHNIPGSFAGFSQVAELYEECQLLKVVVQYIPTQNFSWTQCVEYSNQNPYNLKNFPLVTAAAPVFATTDPQYRFIVKPPAPEPSLYWIKHHPRMRCHSIDRRFSLSFIPCKRQNIDGQITTEYYNRSNWLRTEGLETDKSANKWSFQGWGMYIPTLFNQAEKEVEKKPFNKRAFVLVTYLYCRFRKPKVDDYKITMDLMDANAPNQWVDDILQDHAQDMQTVGSGALKFDVQEMDTASIDSDTSVLDDSLMSRLVAFQRKKQNPLSLGLSEDTYPPIAGSSRTQSHLPRKNHQG